MKLFTELFTAIDQSTKTNDKVAALTHYLAKAAPEDSLYAIALLTGNKPKRPVATADLRRWASEAAGIPEWLFAESYYVVGDLAETITLLLPPHNVSADWPLHEVMEILATLKNQEDGQKWVVIEKFWQSLPKPSIFVFNKLLTGNFRMGVSRQLVIKALAAFLKRDSQQIAHQLMGKWNPAKETIETLLGADSAQDRYYQPYPFFLAYPLDNVGALGNIEDWIIEKKMDGIRGQLIARKGKLILWSRGEDLITDKFPEFMGLENVLPDGTVIDGELIPYKDGHFLDFNALQTRIGRKNISKKILSEVPVTLVAYDVLEWQGKDVRALPLLQRRRYLKELLASIDMDNRIILSESLSFPDWNAVDQFRQRARSQQCEGVMLKKKDSIYEAGRKRSGWWKWKSDPMTIDGVLLYAQSGHGRRANLFTDYTFAVWDDEGKLVPFAKAYSGLTDKEILSLDNWVKRNTIEKFGPVRSVTPHWVFEIAFEGISESPRHKSGIALRFPRILRWRTDKQAQDANTMADLREMLHHSF